MNSMTPNKLDEILTTQKLIITCGTGGVGKTTVSSALAIRAALLGKRALVITIDPARRLKTSLGVDDLGDQDLDLTAPIAVALRRIEPTRTLPSSAKFAALMPDTRKTLEALISSLTTSEKLAKRIFSNPIFEIFAKEFSGTNEYMALKRLHSLYRSNQYDCIILDTPPSRNTLDFLEAPTLLARFFDEKLIRWLVLPTNRLLHAGMRKAFGMLEKLTGAGFMTHLFDFASAIFEVQEGFTRTLREVTELLKSPRAGFVLVTTPTLDTAPEAKHFVEIVSGRGFRYDGLILNRTFGHLKLSPDAQNNEATRLMRALQAREQIAVQRIAHPILSKLPELNRDIHCLEDLIHVALALDLN